jgi:phospholipid-binding lipoprotein MlaA
MHTNKLLAITLLLATLSLVTGCATTSTADPDAAYKLDGVDPIDPFETVNRKFYAFNEDLDQHLVKPLASKYVEVTSEPVRIGVTNFFNNLNYVNVILNSSLQGKLDQGLSDLFRFIFNTTLGVGGLFDVATRMGLEEHKEDVGQTLAVWGFGQGPYLTLPLFGPNTARDAPDLIAIVMLNPLSYLVPPIMIPATTLNIVNRRAGLLKASSIRDVAAIDGYSFSREAYLQQRHYLIFDGSPPSESYDDFFNDDFFNQPLEDGFF